MPDRCSLSGLTEEEGHVRRNHEKELDRSNHIRSRGGRAADCLEGSKAVVQQDATLVDSRQAKKPGDRGSRAGISGLSVGDCPRTNAAGRKLIDFGHLPRQANVPSNASVYRTEPASPFG